MSKENFFPVFFFFPERREVKEIRRGRSHVAIGETERETAESFRPDDNDSCLLHGVSHTHMQTLSSAVYLPSGSGRGEFM